MKLKMTSYAIGVLFVLILAITSKAQDNRTVQQQTVPPEKTSQVVSSETEKQLDALNAEVFRNYNEGQYPRAMPIAERALDLGERSFGQADARIVTPLINLAQLKVTVAKFREGDDAKSLLKEAQSLYVRALSITETVLGRNDPQIAKVSLSLAQVYRLQKQDQKAEESFRRAIVVNKSVSGVDSLDVARVSYMLAEFHNSNRESKKAEPLYLRAIAIYEAKLPEEDQTAAKAIERYECFLLENKGTGAFHEYTKKHPAKSSLADQGIVNGKALDLPKPYYPPWAKAEGLAGVIAVRVTISKEGRVMDARAICGNFKLIRLVNAVVYKAQFSPTRKDGRPI